MYQQVAALLLRELFVDALHDGQVGLGVERASGLWQRPRDYVDNNKKKKIINN
jgi:hypothetical protein